MPRKVKMTTPTYPVKRSDGTTVHVTIPVDEWTCPRCGLYGDHMKSPDPDRCRTCCTVDAADDLYRALRDLAGPDGDLHDPRFLAAAHAALARAEGKEP